MSFFLFPFIAFGSILLFAALFTVKQQTAAIIERFGKFQSIRQSGLHLKIPLIDRISGRLSLKIQQLDVLIETKTLDDVFVRLKVSRKEKERLKRLVRSITPKGFGVIILPIFVNIKNNAPRIINSFEVSPIDPGIIPKNISA